MINSNRSLKKVLSLSDITYLIVFISSITILFFINDGTFQLILGSIALLDLILFSMIISKRFDTYIDEKDSKIAFASVTRNNGDFTRNIFRADTYFKNEALENENIGNPISQNSNSGVDKSNTDNNDSSNKIPPAKIPGEEFSSVRIVGKLKTDYKAAEKAMEDEKKIVAETRKDNKQDAVNSNFDLKSFFDEDTIIGNEPKREFDYIISKLLLIFKTVTKTSTAVFFMVSPDRSGFLIQSYVTADPKLFTKKRHIENGNDLISRIISSKQPEIINNLNPSGAKDLLPYFIEGSNIIQSFVGVPVLFKDEVIGVISADSEYENAFTEVTVKFLANFSKIISASVQGFIHKYDLIQASKTLDSIKLFNSIAYDSTGNQNISGAIIDTLVDTFEYSRVGIGGFDENSHKWILKAFKSNSEDNNYNIGDEIEMRNSVIGKSIIENSTVVLEIDENTPLRINSSDRHLDFGHFIAIPIKSPSNTFGALFIEREADKNFTLFEIGLLEMIGAQAGSAIERIHFIEALRSAAMFDLNTGILNKNAFSIRLSEEISRSLDFNIPITLCLFSIDKYSAFDPEIRDENNGIITQHVIDLVNKHIASYDMFGKLNTYTYGILLAGTTTDNAKIWAEKLRSNIANQIIKIGDKKYSVTVSIGIAKFENNDTIQSLIENASKVLEISTEKTNCVTIFN